MARPAEKHVRWTDSSWLFRLRSPVWIASDGLDISRRVGWSRRAPAEAGYADVQAAFIVDERALGPNTPDQLLQVCGSRPVFPRGPAAALGAVLEAESGCRASAVHRSAG